MSLSQVPMGVVLLLQDRGLLDGTRAVCDFGSQEFDSRNPSTNGAFESLFARRGVAVPEAFYDGETHRMYGTSRDYFGALGLDYASFDIDGRWGSLALDLNVEHVPASSRGRYDLTMNLGTSEHVFNQDNFFRQAHDVTAVGGLMVHVVPFHNYQNHGFYSYSPCFFFSLARYNQYEPLALFQCGKPGLHVYRSSHRPPQGQRAVLISVQRRLSDAPFVPPLQVNEPMVLSDSAEQRYGTFAPERIELFKTNGVLPEEFFVDIETGDVHDGLPESTDQKAAAPRRREPRHARTWSGPR